LATVIATTVWVSRVLPAGTRGTALGILWTMHMLATAASSQIGAMLADRQHHYNTTIVTLALLVAAATVLVAVQPDPDATPAPSQELTSSAA
jgi:predicted MFS family arabinose efflux permease